MFTVKLEGIIAGKPTWVVAASCTIRVTHCFAMRLLMFKRSKGEYYVKDRHEENQRFWNKWKNDPKFMERRRARNNEASRRYREKKKLRATDDAEIKRNRREPDEKHVYSPDLHDLEERAAIKEFDGNKERKVAEEEALNEHLDIDPNFDFF
jgi:hypothetical protein